MFRHCNLNGLAAHDFVKVRLMNALITAHNSEITCLSENFLSSTVPHNDENNGSSLLRNDNQNSIKRE